MENLNHICSETKDAISDSINWVNENLDSDESKPLLRHLKSFRAKSRNLEKFSKGRPSLAVYGESQIGKSYFMSELLKNKEANRFYLSFKAPQEKYNKYFEGEYLDFLARVNPDGGKESSGIVTRFTINQDMQSPDAQIPVVFLRQVDLAMILTDTYALDIKETDELNDFEYADIIELLKELSTSQSESETDGMIEDDVIDYKNYLNKYLDEGFSTIRLFEKNKIWDDVISLLPRIPYNKRYKIFELFWGKLPVLTEVFNKLSDVLKKIDFSQNANLELDAILPKEINGKKSSIIDVGTLADFYEEEKLPPINIHTKNNVVSDVGIGEVTALVREMTLTVDDRIVGEENRKFLNDVDVYDFPGARTRKEYNVDRLSSLKTIHDSESDSEDNILHECITRGKVNYLFNYYSDMHDITTLIFAQKNSNQNVNTLPKQIDNWVVNAHGETPQQRQGQNPNLFISFHFFNIELNGKPSDIEGDVEQYNGLWTNRLEVNVEKFITKQIRTEDNWLENWSPGQRFQNFVFLRDPDPAFNSATRFNEDGEEIYNEGFEQKHKDMRTSFLNTPAVKKYIKNPEEVWEHSAALNNTGVEYIIKQITPVTSYDNRLRQFQKELKSLISVACEKLQPYFQSGDHEEAKKEVLENTKKTMKTLLYSHKETNSFGMVLDSLELDDDLAWKTLYDVQNPVFDHHINEDGSVTSNQHIQATDKSELKDIDLDEFAEEFDLDLEDDENPSEEGQNTVNKKHKTKSDIFVDQLVANWLETIEDHYSEERIKKVGLTYESVKWLTQNLKDSINRMSFKQTLIEEVSDEVERYVQNTDSIFLVARLAKNYFNEFVNTFGWSYTALEDRPQLKNSEKVFYKKMYKNNPYVVKSLNYNDLTTDSTDIVNIRFKHWLKAFEQACIENLNEKYKDGGIITDPEANAELGNILNNLKKSQERSG